MNEDSDTLGQSGPCAPGANDRKARGGLSVGDIAIDRGNSFNEDSIERHLKLRARARFRRERVRSILEAGERPMRFAAPACAVLLLGQPGGTEGPEANPHYRGQFVFTRIRYGDSANAFSYFGGRSTWSHDYPRADLHLSRLLSELTTIDANVSSTNVLTLDDPELFRYPIAYISEPGFWTLSDEDAENLRSYLLKGGFLIFDDFEHEQWHNFEAQMMRVVPDHRLVELDVSHPIFRSFFEMRTIDFPHPLVNVMPTYFGIFEDNNPAKRLMAIVNYNNDIAEYWEWSDAGWFPIEITNEAYKLGINYMVYALTH